MRSAKFANRMGGDEDTGVKRRGRRGSKRPAETIQFQKSTMAGGGTSSLFNAFATWRVSN